MRLNTRQHLPDFSSCLLLLSGLFMANLAGALPVRSKPPVKKTVYIDIKLRSAAKASVRLAALKYNKHVAFSFTLDGYRSAYTCAYPLLNGGMVSPSIPDEYNNNQGGDGEHSDGLFYSDGCGQKIPFKLALAINAGIIYDKPDNRARLSWPELQKLYHAGWDILNHSYHHATKHGTDFYNEVAQNITTIKEKLSFTMTQFVVPGGPSDPGYEHEYEKDAFKTGSYAVASYVGLGPVINVEQPVKLDSMIYARDLLKSYKDSVDFASVDKDITKIDSLMQQPHPVWYNAFTHNVGNGNLWSISLIYPEFKYYMTTIANKYGSGGSDQLWMAPWQEVYEYIWLKDHTIITTRQKGRNLVVKLKLPQIPPNFRNKALSLVVKTGDTFSIVSYSSDLKISDNGTKKHQLINLKIN